MSLGRSTSMHFAIDGQSGGLVGFVIVAGAICLVAFIVVTTVLQRVAGSRDGASRQMSEADEEVLP